MRTLRRRALLLLLLVLPAAGLAAQADPHPWIAVLQRDLQEIEADVNRGAWGPAERRARMLRDAVADALPVWREELENVRERGLIGDFAVFVRDVPAAAARRDLRRFADAVGRCRAILEQLRLEHESRFRAR
jgi:hypothetical protein